MKKGGNQVFCGLWGYFLFREWNPGGTTFGFQNSLFPTHTMHKWTHAMHTYMQSSRVQNFFTQCCVTTHAQLPVVPGSCTRTPHSCRANNPPPPNETQLLKKVSPTIFLRRFVHVWIGASRHLPCFSLENLNYFHIDVWNFQGIFSFSLALCAVRRGSCLGWLFLLFFFFCSIGSWGGLILRGFWGGAYCWGVLFGRGS